MNLHRATSGTSRLATTCTRVAKDARKHAAVALAGACVALAIAGLVLPLLPTTPFVLLASYLLTRNSPEWNRRLLSSPLVGPCLNDWQRYHAVRRQTKWRASLAVLACIGMSLLMTAPSPRTLLLLLSSAAAGLAVIACLPEITVPDSRPSGAVSDVPLASNGTAVATIRSPHGNQA